MVLAFLTVFKIDYYIIQPGHAYNVAEFIDSKETHKHEGTLSLMTITQMRATPISYAISLAKPYTERQTLEQARGPVGDDKEYDVRQTKLMTDSQFNAKYIAFEKLGLPTNITIEGVFIMSVLADGAAADKLQPGDEVIAVDDEKITSSEFFTQYIQTKQLHDEVKITYIRNKKQRDVTIALKELPGDKDKRIGLGVAFGEAREITTTPPVDIAAEGISGPSAGLMFTLGVINALSEEDITKGHNVAGTGTMNLDGSVGSIGGIDMKVVAADADGMEIFFAPAVLDPRIKEKYPEQLSNYELAVKTAKEIKTKMKIVPVTTVDDALAYLKEL